MVGPVFYGALDCERQFAASFESVQQVSFLVDYISTFWVVDGRQDGDGLVVVHSTLHT